MARLFDVTQIKNLKLGNRFIRSATWEGLAREDGACTHELIDLMAKLAKSHVGLISATLAPSHEEKILP